MFLSMVAWLIVTQYNTTRHSGFYSLHIFEDFMKAASCVGWTPFELLLNYQQLVIIFLISCFCSSVTWSFVLCGIYWQLCSIERGGRSYGPWTNSFEFFKTFDWKLCQNFFHSTEHRSCYVQGLTFDNCDSCTTTTGCIWRPIVNFAGRILVLMTSESNRWEHRAFSITRCNGITSEVIWIASWGMSKWLSWYYWAIKTLELFLDKWTLHCLLARNGCIQDSIMRKNYFHIAGSDLAI